MQRLSHSALLHLGPKGLDSRLKALYLFSACLGRYVPALVSSRSFLTWHVTWCGPLACKWLTTLVVLNTLLFVR